MSDDRSTVLYERLNKRLHVTLGMRFSGQGRQYAHVTPRILMALGEVQASSRMRLPLLPTIEGDDLVHSDVAALYRVLRTVYLAELVFGDVGRARKWLCSPKRRLRGRVPLLMAGYLEQAHRLEGWLMEIDEGCHS